MNEFDFMYDLLLTRHQALNLYERYHTLDHFPTPYIRSFLEAERQYVLFQQSKQREEGELALSKYVWLLYDLKNYHHEQNQ